MESIKLTLNSMKASCSAILSELRDKYEDTLIELPITSGKKLVLNITI